MLGDIRNIHTKKVSTIFEVNESDTDIDKFELEKTMMTKNAKEQDFKEAAAELELIANMTSTIDF